MVRYNEELVQRLCGKIATGIPISHACASEALGRTQFYKWMREGKKGPTNKYYSFYKRIEKAKADAIAIRVARINRAGEQGTWQADAWWLERVDPEHFSKKDKLQVDAQAKVESKSFDNLLNAFEESKRQWNKNKKENNSN